MPAPLARIPLMMALCLTTALGLRAGAAEPPTMLPGQKPYVVTVDRVAAQRGQPATARVVFKPAAGYHLNKEFPTTLKLRPLPKDVTSAKTAFSLGDAKLSNEEGSFEVVLTASEPGAKSVGGELRFAVCTETTCNPQHSPVSIELQVQ